MNVANSGWSAKTAVLRRMQIRTSFLWWKWCWTKACRSENSTTMRSRGLLCRETAGSVCQLRWHYSCFSSDSQTGLLFDRLYLFLCYNLCLPHFMKTVIALLWNFKNWCASALGLNSWDACEGAWGEVCSVLYCFQFLFNCTVFCGQYGSRSNFSLKLWYFSSRCHRFWYTTLRLYSAICR